MFVCRTSLADDFADDLLPVNNEDTASIAHPIAGANNRNVKREALVNILIDIMDRFYVSRRIYAKRPQDDDVNSREKTDE